MDRVFNQGIGMAVIVAADEAERLTERFRELGEKAWIIGSVCEGDGVQILP
jgi:phosphoribosylformylglycinamidine cyclo-ligase